MPGVDWVTLFMARWNLSMKVPSTVEKSRNMVAGDPDDIHEFFAKLEQVLDQLGISNQLDCIWNVDETTLFIDSHQTKINSCQGMKDSRVTATSGHEPITVMAGVNAAGNKLPPLIIFKGEQI